MTDQYFKTRFIFDKSRDKVWRAICNDLRKYIPTEATIMDLGCGYGDFINNIHAKNKLAVDISPESKNFCKGSILFHQSSSHKLDFVMDESVDVVFSSNLLEHLDEETLAETLRELFRIIRKSGKLILLQPNYKYCYREYFDDYTHKKIFSHISLSDCVKSFGFRLYRSFPKYLPLSLKSRLPKSYWLTRIYLWSPIKPLAKQMLLVFEK
jgi:SAM-dependent methyltransferase